MNHQNRKAPNSTEEPALVANETPTSERLYQFAALTVVICLLATML